MPASAHARSESTGRDSKLKRLLIRPGAIGDTIVSLPALEHCARSIDYCEVWVSSACVPLIRFAHQVRSIASTGLDLLELGFKTPTHDRLREFDSIISWYGSNRSEFRSAVAGLSFEFHTALPQSAELHAVDFYLRQVGGSVGGVPCIDIPGRAGNYIAIHPFSGSARKNWPLEKFRELVRGLPYPVEFCAGVDEDLSGALRFEKLDDLAEWLAGARAYIGNDSGVTHLAAAVGAPAAAIFRCTDPAVWAPRGRRPVRVITGDPSVEEVLSAMKELLI